MWRKGLGAAPLTCSQGIPGIPAERGLFAGGGALEGPAGIFGVKRTRGAHPGKIGNAPGENRECWGGRSSSRGKSGMFQGKIRNFGVSGAAPGIKSGMLGGREQLPSSAREGDPIFPLPLGFGVCRVPLGWGRNLGCPQRMGWSSWFWDEGIFRDHLG